MEGIKTAIIIASLVLFFIPTTMIVKKFTSYDTAVNFRVSFDPVTCYACRDCPCEYELNNGDKYFLTSYDKNYCTTDHEEINTAIENELDRITIELEIPEYRNFYDCLKWYTTHPTMAKID